MHRDLLNGADRRAAFLRATKIERVLQAQATQRRNIGFGQMSQMVGAEDLPPAHRAAVMAGIAAEIAKIAGADEVVVADGQIGHLVIPHHPPRWKTAESAWCAVSASI